MKNILKVFILSLTLLCGCSCKQKVDDLAVLLLDYNLLSDDSKIEKRSGVEVTLNEELSYKDIVTSFDDLLYVVKQEDNTLGFYSIVSNKYISDKFYTSDVKFEVRSINNSSYKYIVIDYQGSSKVYDFYGNCFESLDSYTFSLIGLYSQDNKDYYVCNYYREMDDDLWGYYIHIDIYYYYDKDNKLVKAYETHQNDKDYYSKPIRYDFIDGYEEFSYSYNENILSVYKNYELVSTFENVMSYSFYNDKIIYSVATLFSIDSDKKYGYIDGDKYNISSYIYDINKKENNELDTNLLIYDIKKLNSFNKEEYFLIDYMAINNNKTLSSLKSAIIDKEMSVRRDVTGMNYLSMIKVTEDRYYNSVTNIIYDNELKVVADISMMGFLTYLKDQKVFVHYYSPFYILIDLNGKSLTDIYEYIYFDNGFDGLFYASYLDEYYLINTNTNESTLIGEIGEKLPYGLKSLNAPFIVKEDGIYSPFNKLLFKKSNNSNSLEYKTTSYIEDIIIFVEKGKNKLIYNVEYI